MIGTDFPDCCGIKVLSGFGHSTTGLEATPFTLEEISNFLDAQTKYYTEMGKAMLVATINCEQYPIMGELFKEKGWVEASKSYHRNHDKTIYLFVKTLE